MFWYRLGMADSRSLSERLSKLPPGRHLIPRDFVSQNQRERMLLATAELVAELERHIGPDLQYIRINGTLVGGLAGLLIAALTQLVR